MAGLWEVSAVIAMRDLQWLFRSEDDLPDAGINLAGHAESRLGDLAAHINDRFFLFEIKPQSSDFASEWKMKKRGGKEKRTKHAYASVLDIAKKWSAAPGDPAATKKLIDSLRCHHFAYWHVGVPTPLLNRLCLQPYLGAVIEGSLSVHGLNEVVTKIANDLTLAHSEVVDRSGNAFAFEKCKSASVGAAHHGHLGIAVYQRGRPYEWMELGLPIDDFQNYINLLMTHAPDHEEKLNSVAISTGGWQRVMGSTKDLARLLNDLKAAPSSAPREAPADARLTGAGRSSADSVGGSHYHAVVGDIFSPDAPKPSRLRR